MNENIALFSVLQYEACRAELGYTTCAIKARSLTGHRRLDVKLLGIEMTILYEY